MPVVVGVLLVLAGLAVVRNILFFRGNSPSTAVATALEDEFPKGTPATPSGVVTAGTGSAAPTAATGPTAAAPIEVRMATWLTPAPGTSPVQPAAVDRDPFHFPPRRHSVRQSARVAHRVQAVLTGPERTVALVDGLPVAPGERIGGLTVAAITPDGVSLVTRQGERWIKFEPPASDGEANGDK